MNKRVHQVYWPQAQGWPSFRDVNELLLLESQARSPLLAGSQPRLRRSFGDVKELLLHESQKQRLPLLAGGRHLSFAWRSFFMRPKIRQKKR